MRKPPEHQTRHSEETRQKIIDLWARTERSSNEISKLFGMSRGGVSGMTHRYMQQRGFPSRAFLQAQCSKLPEIDWWKDGPKFSHGDMEIAVKAHPLALRTNKGNGILPRKAVALRVKAVRAKTSQGQGLSHQRPSR